MGRKLLPNETPIEAGPIIISRDYAMTLDLADDYVSLRDFNEEVREHELRLRSDKSNLALRLSVEALINHLGLEILPPNASEVLETGEIWGPYQDWSYSIFYRDYLKYFGVIKKHVCETVKVDNEGIINLLQYARETADELRYIDIDFKSIEELPGAVYTFKRPNKHIHDGHLIEFEDFLNAYHRPISTTPGKVVQVFDRVVQRLGDEKAKLELKKLDHEQVQYKRRYIRDSIYIKTQTLADLIVELSALPEKERKDFNNLSLEILRFVLNDESIEDLMGTLVVKHN